MSEKPSPIQLLTARPEGENTLPVIEESAGCCGGGSCSV